MFSFILCVGVLRERGEIDDDVWSYFLSSQAITAANALSSKTGTLKLKSEPNGKNIIILCLHCSIV